VLDLDEPASAGDREALLRRLEVLAHAAGDDGLSVDDDVSKPYRALGAV